jgi:hypothetical protein
MVALLVGLLGALAGIVLAVATDVVSRSAVRGDGWSLAGNGALVVLFAGGPAVLAGGWAALARWRARDARWGAVGALVGLTAFVAAGLASFGPVLAVGALGPGVLEGDDGAQTALGVTFLAPPLIAFAGGMGMAAWLGRIRWVGGVAELVVLALAAVLVAVVPGAYFLLGPLVVLPLLASAPVVFLRTVRPPLFAWPWLLIACIALTVGLAGGVIAAQRIQGL